MQLLDTNYEFRGISKEKAADLGAHVEYRNGIEVPCAKTLAELEEADGKLKSPTTPTKRQAEGEPEGQSALKRPASATDEPGPAAVPRHIGGLLSAILPPDEEGVHSMGGDSKLPSPSPQPAAGDSPEELLDTDAAAQASPFDDEKLPPMPNGASEADAFGVRIVNKRKLANIEVNNRIMAPALFEFEPHEIGFRDSTNDKTRGATKAKRGKFLGTPNSNTMHFDRNLLAYDVTLNDDGDLDDELIKKYGLHPKYGIFLKTSVNQEEPPKEFVSGQKPVVFITPDGKTLATSRSVAPARLDERVQLHTTRLALQTSLLQLCQAENIEAEAIQPPNEAVEEHRRFMLQDYAAEKGAVETGGEADEEAEAAASQTIATLLEAATTADAEEARAASAAVTPRRPTISRSFDPVRNAFLGPKPSPPPPAEKLSALVDIALSYRPEYRQEPAASEAMPLTFPAAMSAGAPPLSMPAAMSLPAATHTTMPLAMPVALPPHTMPTTAPPIGLPSMPSTMSATSSGYEMVPLQPEWSVYDSRLYGEVTAPGHATNLAPQPNAFLQTALNPPTQYPGPAPPAPVSYPGPPLAPAPPPAMQHSVSPPARMPFGNPVHGSAIPPGLPPLRPSRGRSMMDEAPTDPAYGPPRPLAMVSSGGYFQPPTTSRPFQGGGYSTPEQQPPPPVMSGPGYIQEMVQYPQGMPPPHPAGPPPSQLMPQGPPGPGSHPRTASYPGSPPFQGHGHPQPSSMMDGLPMVPHGPGSPPPLRYQAGLSASAQSSKYRKLEPAPTPPHRIGWSSNGSELRTVPYDYREGIKDYNPVEPPPRSGPTHIRGWAHNNMKKPRAKPDASLEQGPEEPK